jgi:murein DD-endopeptidase MepM/ murein hydrolase activator NlpD
VKGAPGCGLGCGCAGLAGALALALAIGLAGALGGVWATSAAAADSPTSGGATGAIVWPVDGVLTQRFGPTRLTLEPRRCYAGRCYAHFHDGIDLAAPMGTPVRAMAAGRVLLAGRVTDGAVVVGLDHGAGLRSLYGHLEVELAVRAGDTVVAGQVLGQVGMTGNTTGPHLHFGTWQDRVPVDPLGLLPARP